MASRSSAETRGYPQFLQQSAAAIAMCFGRSRGKQNRLAQASSAFPPKEVLKTLFTAPRRRDEWNAWEKMTGKNQARAKNANESEDQETMTPEPVHAGGI